MLRSNAAMVKISAIGWSEIGSAVPTRMPESSPSRSISFLSLTFQDLIRRIISGTFKHNLTGAEERSSSKLDTEGASLAINIPGETLR
jgi:hypothetical protein